VSGLRAKAAGARPSAGQCASIVPGRQYSRLKASKSPAAKGSGYLLCGPSSPYANKPRSAAGAALDLASLVPLGRLAGTLARVPGFQRLAQAAIRRGAAKGPARARELGRAGEAAAGIERNTERIRSALNPASYRVPDVLDRRGVCSGKSRTSATCPTHLSSATTRRSRSVKDCVRANCPPLDAVVGAAARRCGEGRC
jgi:hypothetical protein